MKLTFHPDTAPDTSDPDVAGWGLVLVTDRGEGGLEVVAGAAHVNRYRLSCRRPSHLLQPPRDRLDVVGGGLEISLLPQLGRTVFQPLLQRNLLTGSAFARANDTDPR